MWEDDEYDDYGNEPLGKLDAWESWDWTEIDLPPGPEYLFYKQLMDDERVDG